MTISLIIITPFISMWHHSCLPTVTTTHCITLLPHTAPLTLFHHGTIPISYFTFHHVVTSLFFAPLSLISLMILCYSALHSIFCCIYPCTVISILIHQNSYKMVLLYICYDGKFVLNSSYCFSWHFYL
jgi:hypothetical protein